MADFDLTQTDAQVQSILNDGQNMQGAGAQTTLTTESVLLKDVNGNYHKILKSSFTEAIRDTLAGLLVNNDKGTTINQIAAIASGDFGSITPANLASVLGVGNSAITSRISPNGWYRFLDLGWSTEGGAFFLLSLTNNYKGSAPANLLFLVGTGNYGRGTYSFYPFVQQIGKGNRGKGQHWITGLRIVKDGDSTYLDILFANRIETGNNVRVTVVPLLDKLYPIFSFGTEIGSSLTELAALTVDYLT